MMKNGEIGRRKALRMLLKKEVRHFLKNGGKKLKLLYKPFVCYAGGPIQKPGKYLQARSKYDTRYHTSAIIVLHMCNK